MIYSIDTIAVIDTDYDCGDLDLRLYNADDESPLDPELFAIDNFAESMAF